MWKKIIIAIVAMVCAEQAAHAVEVQRVQPFEVELGGGMTVPIDDRYSGADRLIGPTFDLEMRYNFSGTPWACGMFVAMDWASWNQDSQIYNPYSHHNRTLRIGFLGEYNLRQGKRVNPFASMGIGVGFSDNIGDTATDPSRTLPVFVPKVGVEFYRWLRVNAFFQISQKGYNVFGLTVGFTLGGRPRN